MPIAYEELAGSPKLAATHWGAKAVRSFRVAWDDWLSFARSLLGYAHATAGVATFVAPTPFPGLENLIVTEIAVEPFDPESPAAQPELDLRRDTNRYESGARVTATYEALAQWGPSGRRGMPSVPTGTYLSFRGDLGVESIRTPGRYWRWPTSGSPPLADDVNPLLTIPSGHLQLTWLRVHAPPWSAQRALRGKVNAGEFLGAPAGTVLFTGARVAREFQILDDAALWRIDYFFAEQTEPLAGGGHGGWNHYYREEAEGDEHWLAVADEDGNPPYAAGDFDALFQFE